VYNIHSEHTNTVSTHCTAGWAWCLKLQPKPCLSPKLAQDETAIFQDPWYGF